MFGVDGTVFICGGVGIFIVGFMFGVDGGTVFVCGGVVMFALVFGAADRGATVDGAIAGAVGFGLGVGADCSMPEEVVGGVMVAALFAGGMDCTDWGSLPVVVGTFDFSIIFKLPFSSITVTCLSPAALVPVISLFCVAVLFLVVVDVSAGSISANTADDSNAREIAKKMGFCFI